MDIFGSPLQFGQRYHVMVKGLQYQQQSRSDDEEVEKQDTGCTKQIPAVERVSVHDISAVRNDRKIIGSFQVHCTNLP